MEQFNENDMDGYYNHNLLITGVLTIVGSLLISSLAVLFWRLWIS